MSEKMSVRIPRVIGIIWRRRRMMYCVILKFTPSEARGQWSSSDERATWMMLAEVPLIPRFARDKLRRLNRLSCERPGSHFHNRRNRSPEHVEPRGDAPPFAGEGFDVR